MKVLKLIPKILISLILAVRIVYVLGNVIAAVSSIVTNPIQTLPD